MRRGKREDRERWFFRGGRVFDGRSDHALERASVVVEGERITTVAEGRGPEPGPGDQVVELAGRTLMPGMISSHFHSTFEGVTPGGAPSLGLEAPPAYLAMLAVKNARLAIEHGVTSVLGSSCPYSIDASLKQAIEAAMFAGPRVVCGSRELMITSDLASAGSHNFYMELGNTGLVRTVPAGPEAWREATREEIRRGAEIIKLSLSQGHNAGPATGGVNLTPAELDAVVAAARTHGLRVRAHAATRAAILECCRAGVDIIDHADRVDAECIDAILAADCSVVPSVLYSARVVEAYDAGFFDALFQGRLPPTLSEVMEDMRGSVEHMLGMLPELQRAGVRLLAGDDYGTFALAHGEYGAELGYYVKHAGLSPVDVIRWATESPSRLMPQGAELGAIAPGRLADLILVEGDPLSDIACLEDEARVSLVMKGGLVQKNRLRSERAAQPA